MFFIRFVTGSLIGAIVGIIVGILMLAVVLGVIVFSLIAVGGPDPCTPGGGEIVISDANADAFDRKWEAFDDILDTGSPSFVVLNESEISSRADRLIDEEGGDIDDVRICLHGGFGEITGSVEAFLGIDADFKAMGSVDLSGDHPVVNLDDIEIGSLPGFSIDPFEGLLEDAIEELLDELDLEHRYIPTLMEGDARIDGVP